MKLSIPLLIIFLIIGASLEVLLPSLPFALPLKLPILIAIASYYILERPTSIALIFAILSGITHDYLSSTPIGTSLIILSCTVFAIKPIWNYLPENIPFLPSFLAFILTLVITWVQYITLLSSGYAVPFYMVILPSFVSSLLIAFIALFLSPFLHFVEVSAGNIEPRKEVES